jgi:hypothetical protein
MGETIAKTGVKRDKGLIYYIKGGDVWGSPLKKPNTPKGKAAKIASTGVELDYSKYMYYVGTDANNELVVERTDRQVGGSKRKKSAKAAAPKKAKAAPKKMSGGKKAAAKKAPAKKGGGKKGKRK